MAGDWIKAEKVTPRKPEVLRMAAKLGVHPDHAFGLCFRFWSWCDDNLNSCNATGVTEVMLDALLERDGVASALIDVGWLQVRNGSLVIPNFDRHLSESAKKRGLSAKRTADSRSRKCNAKNVTEVLPEKRREEIKEREVANANRIPFLETRSVKFLEAWARWKRHSQDNGKPIGAMSEETQLKSLFEAYPNEIEAINALDFSMKNNWRNIDLRNSHNRKDEKPERTVKTNSDKLGSIFERAFNQ